MLYTPCKESPYKVKTDVVIKFILETGYLSPDQIRLGAKLIRESGADFVKFTTGMERPDATLKDLKLIKEVVGNTIRIKVAGGIDTYEEAIPFINAGVTRIGTSHAMAIVTNVSHSSSTRPESSE